VCCSVLQCVAVCVGGRESACAGRYSGLQSHMHADAVHCCVLQYTLLLTTQCVTVCSSVLQCVAVCCSVLQCAAVCCSVLQYSVLMQMQCGAAYVVDVDAVRCSALQCVAVRCSALQSAKSHARRCSVLQCVAVCCSVLQCVAVYIVHEDAVLQYVAVR